MQSTYLAYQQLLNDQVSTLEVALKNYNSVRDKLHLGKATQHEFDIAFKKKEDARKDVALIRHLIDSLDNIEP